MILYHENCMDGTFAALIAQDATGQKAIPISYHDDLAAFLDESLTFVDFCPNAAFLDLALERTPGLVVIDHHATQRWVMECTWAGLVFDEEHSGAALAWRHFFPDKPMPMVVRYVEDRDLWRWKMPFSREVSAGLRLRGFDPADHSLGVSVSSLIAEGAAALKANSMVVKAIADHAVVDPGSPLVHVENHVLHLTSEIGHELVERHEKLAAMWSQKGEGYLVSLRGPGAREMAEKHGGGGHDRAAGFHCRQLPWTNAEADDE